MNQFSIIGTVRSVNQTLHGEVVVFTAHWIDGVKSLVVFTEIQTIVPRQTECFVSNCGVPVGIYRTIFFSLIKVKVNLVGILIGRSFNQLIVIWIIFITADSLQVTFCQVYIIQFARLIQLECYVVGFYHLNGNGIKQLCIFIPVSWVLGEDLFIVLNICSHGIAAIVPHIFVVHSSNTIYTQFINHCLRHWIQTCIGCNSIKVWFWFDTMINQGIIVRNFYTNHFHEFGAFACC